MYQRLFQIEIPILDHFKGWDINFNLTAHKRWLDLTFSESVGMNMFYI